MRRGADGRMTSFAVMRRRDRAGRRAVRTMSSGFSGAGALTEVMVAILVQSLVVGSIRECRGSGRRSMQIGQIRFVIKQYKPPSIQVESILIRRVLTSMHRLCVELLWRFFLRFAILTRPATRMRTRSCSGHRTPDASPRPRPSTALRSTYCRCIC